MPITILELLKMKERRQKITMLTAYDHSTAQTLDQAGVDLILVGDSLGMVFQGRGSTLQVTLEEMLYHTSAVARGVQNALVIGDMPFLTYQINSDEALRNAGRFLQHGAQAVKLEGGVAIASTVRRAVDIGIPVMGHIGLTPQSVNQLSGYRVQGRAPSEVVTLLADARALEDAGAFAIVLECVPSEVAAEMAAMLRIPLIGIGAGSDVDGQVLVINDVLGTYPGRTAKFVRRYANISEIIDGAARRYIEDVRSGNFPTVKESYQLRPSQSAKKLTDKPAKKSAKKSAKKPAAKPAKKSAKKAAPKLAKKSALKAAARPAKKSADMPAKQKVGQANVTPSRAGRKKSG